MKVIKEIAIRVVLLTSALAFSLLLIEFAIRVFNIYEFTSNDFFEPHPELGWSHIPNQEGYYKVDGKRVHIRINSKGLRDKEYPYKKGKGVFRILVLGDSFAEAFQVPLEDSFPKVLESQFNRKQKAFEVINAGLSGVGTDYQLLFLKREGYKYEPDLVILAFCSNDAYDNYRSKNVLKDGIRQIEYEKKGLAVRIRRFLADNSGAYNYFGLVLPKYFPFLAKILMNVGLMASQPIGDVKRVDQLHRAVFAGDYSAEWEEAWHVTRLLISRLKDEVQNCGGKLAIVSIPFREQVYENVWKSIFSQPGMASLEWDFDKPDRMLLGVVIEDNIPFLPLLPLLREEAKKSQLYYSRDGHWNITGHHFAAKVIFAWLVEQKLVPFRAESKGLRWTK